MSAMSSAEISNTEPGENVINKYSLLTDTGMSKCIEK